MLSPPPELFKDQDTSQLNHVVSRKLRSVCGSFPGGVDCSSLGRKEKSAVDTDELKGPLIIGTLLVLEYIVCSRFKTLLG